MDNQLFTATRPVLLYITPNPQKDGPENTSALNITAQKIPNSKWNAEIYKVSPERFLLMNNHVVLVNTGIYGHCGQNCKDIHFDLSFQSSILFK